MIIGISGKSGSGKSTISKLICDSKPNSLHCDIDKIGHEVLLLKEVKMELIKTFGADIVIEDYVDRKKLGMIVFENREKMKELTSITWSHMELMIDEIIEKNKNNMIVLDWILLPQSKYFDMCDYKILVDSSIEERKRRAMIRDNISEEKFLLRESASIEYDKEVFDLVIKNENLKDIRKLVMKI